MKIANNYLNSFGDWKNVWEYFQMPEAAQSFAKASINFS